MAKQPISDWLRRHAAGERALAADLADYFDRQARRVAARLADLSRPTPADAAQLLSPARDHAALMELVAPHLAKLVAGGAEETLRSLPKRRRGKALAGAWCDIKVETGADWGDSPPRPWDAWVEGEDFPIEPDRAWLTVKAADDDESDLIEFGGLEPIADPQPSDYIPDEMPERMKAAIRSALDELEQQPYWKAIQAATSDRVADLIRGGIDSGQSGSEMAKAIREALGGDGAKVRAKAIARTETTGAFNAGHQATFDYLDDEGLIAGKTWLAITDNRLRESHAALNNVTVRAKDEFDVGGSPAPYPGHFSLPPEERVNCRCTVIGAIEE
jgi:SPP1 gp7 family putative phage head morphogenesis protein